MQIVKIKPKELPKDLVFRLNCVYEMELGEFVAIADNKEEILYVNHTVPQKDIDGFLEVIAFPHYWVADDEAPTGKFLEYVYEKYGFGTYRELLDSHSWRLDKEEEQKAKKIAKKAIPMIEKQIKSENPLIEFDEHLLHEVYCAGLNRKGKTAKNICGYSSIYIFYLGYLMGAGKVKAAGGGGRA